MSIVFNCLQKWAGFSDDDFRDDGSEFQHVVDPTALLLGPVLIISTSAPVDKSIFTLTESTCLLDQPNPHVNLLQNSVYLVHQLARLCEINR